MGRYLNILNLDSSTPVRTSMGGKFGECFWDLSASDTELMNALLRTDNGRKHITARPLCEINDKARPKRYAELIQIPPPVHRIAYGPQSQVH